MTVVNLAACGVVWPRQGRFVFIADWVTTGRDTPAKADQFVEMYVNNWTLDFGPIGRQAVARLLEEGHKAGVIPKLVAPEFVE